MLPDFDMLLARLAGHRRLDIAGLSSSAEIPEPELRAVYEGMAPSPALLRRLAPVLRLHAADLFVIADLPVPDGLAPLDPRAAGLVVGLLKDAVVLPPEHRRRLRRLAGSLPQENRTEPVRTPRAYERFERGPGGVLIRMAGNRNLSWTGIAQTFLILTGRYWAASTYGAVGHGRKELTPDLLADFATVLGVPADTLSVLTGVDVPDVPPPRCPAAVDAAELLWDIRRLTVDQVRQVAGAARVTPGA
ncbi:hypothetical protein SAMN05216489_09381 [Streptomyces sp. 3213]|nr:hypothetical protein SAMN05216489_09381 [Streptomyces sp. 3213] [Streptomyces sp. 3213.3]